MVNWTLNTGEYEENKFERFQFLSSSEICVVCKRVFGWTNVWLGSEFVVEKVRIKIDFQISWYFEEKSHH